MTDFEKFKEYWEQAVNGLAYRISEEKSPVLTRARIQTIWKEELLDKRFLSTGVRHGARIFLDELAQTRPDVAEQVKRRLMESEMPLSVEGTSMVGNAVVAATGLGAACIEKLNLGARLTSLAVGGTFAVKTAQEVRQGTKGVLNESLEQEAAHQLLAYKALLEDAV